MSGQTTKKGSWRDRQLSAGWLLALIILASPTLIVVPPRIGDVPWLLSAAYGVVVVLGLIAGRGLLSGLRGRRMPAQAPVIAGIVIVASLALAIAAGVLTD